MADSPQAPAMDLITLPHHAELLSDRWLEEAAKFFREALPPRRQALQPFSLSERFIDAPPHMKLPGDVAAWSLRFDGQEVAISRTFDETADVVLECEYQPPWPSPVVGVRPGGEEAMWREARAMFGPDALRPRGGLADEPARVLMGLFHDHMARRTVENPDLEHRARRMGLTGKIREMEEQGFTVIERAISETFADEVRAAIKGAVQPQQGVSMNWMLYQGRPFERSR